MPVNSLSVEGRSDSTFNEIKLNEVFIDAGIVSIKLLGDIIKRDDKISFKIQTDFSKFSVNNISKIWPSNILTNARNWITNNIKGGYLESTYMMISGVTDVGDLSEIYFKDVFGKLKKEKEILDEENDKL